MDGLNFSLKSSMNFKKSLDFGSTLYASLKKIKQYPVTAKCYIIFVNKTKSP